MQTIKQLEKKINKLKSHGGYVSGGCPDCLAKLEYEAQLQTLKDVLKLIDGCPLEKGFDILTAKQFKTELKQKIQGEDDNGNRT